MTYGELREAVQDKIDLADYSGIATLMNSVAAALVRNCDPALLKPEEQFNTKSLKTAKLFYDTLLAGLASVTDVDSAVQWFNSSFTYAALAGSAFVVPALELERLDIVGQEKIFDECL